MKSALRNISVVLGSLLVLGLLLEFVVFRFVLRASDLPKNAYLEGAIRFEPDQSGTRRVRNEIAAPFRINAQGWNSGHESYEIEHPVDRERWAIVGDSFIEALQVPFDASMAEILEECSGAQVYRFGTSGSPMSHYVHVVRTVVAPYHPDVVVVVVVHNDFVESYRLRIGRYTSSFLRYRIMDGQVQEIAPEPYEPPRLAWARGSATYRFLVDRMLVNVQAIKERILRSSAEEEFVANIREASIAEEWTGIELAAQHFFGSLAELAAELDSRIVVAIDGDRRSIYEGGNSEALRLNELGLELGARYGLEVVDLHPVFEAAFARESRPFEFRWDGHWNEYAHGVVATELCRRLAAGDR